MIKPGEIYIIAEIGSNWYGLDDCINSVIKAKQCGADCVKFQYFTHEKLYGYPGVMQGELPKEFIPVIAKTAQENKIDLTISCFDHTDIEYINQFVDFHKIASSESSNAELFENILKTKKQVVLSLGGLTPGIRSLHFFIPLYCVSEYPAENLDIEVIKYLNHKTGICGYSDHTANYISALFAKECGATVFERHVTFIDLETPDSCVSMNEEDFKDYCARLKDMSSPLVRFERMRPSQDMIDYYLKREVNGKMVRLKQN